ncbi:MAG: bacterial Ig-like domain-containing protein [Clostridia bacterium]|nr:bacterial Ig-like domain-containing protein [Clostridia bacterium]
MKKQKLVKVLALFTMSAAAISCAAVIGCKKPGSVPHTHTYADEYSYDESGHWYAATCGHDDEKKDFEAHVYDGDDDDDCNICNYVRHNFESAWHYNVDGHWHECTFDGCEETVYSAHDFNEQGICNDCGAQHAVYELIPSDLEATTYTSAYTNGLFTVLADTKIRTRSRENYKVYEWANGEGDNTGEPCETGFYASKSVQLDGTNRGMSVNAIAPGKLTIYVDNGSSGLTINDKQTIVLTRPNGSTQTLSYRGVGMYAITIDCDVVGTYKITRGSGGTTDIYYATFETVVEVTPVEKIEVVDGGKVSYFVGESFDSSRLQINAIHETTLLEEPLSLNAEGLEIDYSEFDGSKAGTYTIYVTYKVDGNTFNDEYEVVVHDVEAIKLGFNGIVQGKNSSAGNGQYINQSVKQFYFKDEDLDLTGLIVKVVANGGKEETIVTEGFEVTGFTKGQAGKQTVTVTWQGTSFSQSFDVYVVNYTAASIADQDITVSVDGSYDDSKVGVLESGAYQFKTIQQSLEFLNELSLNKNTKKTINLAPGTYWEKLEITVPNLTIHGADAATTIIEYDALVGIADESGFVHITDSTATLNIRDTATNFVIEGVTISNWYNSEAHFTEKFGAGYAEHRALAMLIQADMVIIDDCRLLGYQDTIELFTGRQYILNTYICGRTDFIFGTNNTTYFYNCEIESIVNGGYVTAFKGFNKGDGDNDYVQYGAIFDECRFTAPASVITAKDTSLGRTWGKYAAVAYVNCDFAGHICTVPYGTAGAKNTRYTAMSGAAPTDSTVKFVEYNNTGAGAVNQSIAGMTYLTAEEAAKYSDLSIIFGTKNGLVTYSTSWIPVTSDTQTYTVTVYGNGEVIGTLEVVEGLSLTEDRILEIVADSKFAAYDVDGIYSDSNGENEYAYPKINGDGSVYLELSVGAVKASYTHNFRTNTADYVVNTGETKYFGNLEVSGNTGSFAQNGDWYKFLGDATLSVKVKAGTVVTVTTHDGHLAGTFNGADITFEDNTTYTFTATSDGTLVLYKADDGSNQCYIGSIGFAVKTIYSESQTINLVGEVNIQNKVEEYMGIEVDATCSGGKFTLNASQDWIQFNNGTTLKLYVTPNADLTVSLVTYTEGSAAVDMSHIAEGYIIITSTANDYIKTITLTYNA